MSLSNVADEVYLANFYAFAQHGCLFPKELLNLQGKAYFMSLISCVHLFKSSFTHSYITPNVYVLALDIIFLYIVKVNGI